MSELNFTHSNGNKVKLTTPDTLAANKTFKLPGADGSSGQFLKTDGSGALSFATPAINTGSLQVLEQFYLLADGRSVTTANGTVTTGTSANAKSSGWLIWKVPHFTANQKASVGDYHYQCTAHAAMFGQIFIMSVSAEGGSFA